jgi:hypothetical protein
MSYDFTVTENTEKRGNHTHEGNAEEKKAETNK